MEKAAGYSVWEEELRSQVGLVPIPLRSRSISGGEGGGEGGGGKQEGEKTWGGFE